MMHSVHISKEQACTHRSDMYALLGMIHLMVLIGWITSCTVGCMKACRADFSDACTDALRLRQQDYGL